jgi:large subunit ribosomal protein L25
MKSITIKGSKRESVGKSATKALRNAGMVPCVLYGGDEPVHFAAEELAFTKLVYTPNAHTVALEIGEKMKFNAILQDIQFHPLTDKILHIDFYQLFDDKAVSMDIPVKILGAAPGVLNSGGVLSRNKRKLRVRALPANLPDFIEANISNLELGSKLYVTELENENYRFLHPDNTVVCQVRTSRTSLQVETDEQIDEVEAETKDESSGDEKAAEEPKSEQ